MQTIQCPNCLNYIATRDIPACLAFPEGIPEAILRGEHDHKKPYEGDNGFRYAPLVGSDGEL